jgi:hypothetical protein
MSVNAKRVLSAVISIVAVNCIATPAAATEKYWIAHNAQLIVAGTFQPGRGFWWLDGWHETGTMSVDEVLYGRVPAGQLNFRLTIRCAFPWWNRWWPSHFMNQFTDRGLWFLPCGQPDLGPANDCDSGYRLLSDRANFEHPNREALSVFWCSKWGCRPLVQKPHLPGL